MKKGKTQEGLQPPAKKKGKIRSFIEKYDFQLLKKEIESYGYTYSFKNFALLALGCIALMAAVAYYIKLHIYAILFLTTVIVVAIPFIVRSQFGQLYGYKRFEMVTSYLDNIIPIFKRTPIITHAWREILDLLDGEMKDIVEEALEKVMNNTDDPQVLNNAFALIESRFPNTRIHSVHEMMYTIETQNTSNYTLAVDNMWLDVQAWITRVSLFQKELKERKTQLLMLSLLTMFSNCLFVTMYSANELFLSFTDHIVYQVSSTIFMALLILLMTIFQIRLNGKWLIDDQTVAITKKAMSSFSYLQNKENRGQVRVQDKTLALACLLLAGAVFWKTSNSLISLCIVGVAYLAFTTNKRIYKKHLKRIKRYLDIEFPTWIRDVSINLQNLTVINAIENSKKTASPIMCHYIDEFLENVYQDPVGIKPYHEFLADYKMEQVRTTMKMLYSLQSLEKEEMIKNTNSLIIRNQEMLAKAEAIKNAESVSGLKLLGYLPVAVFIAQMLISMGLLFTVMLKLLSTSVTL